MASNNQNFADTIYNGISSALGGTNPNQYLTLMLPGTILNENDFTYNYDGKEAKTAIVEANESRLANKMFDPCKMTATDNGFSLPYQYKMALDSLSPKINKALGDYKNRLRQMLISEYPYDFGDGSDKVYTLQEVYFRLYDEYIEEMHRWNDIQQQKKDELRKQFEINADYEQAYLEWFENNADLYLNEINEKRAKVLSVFSPNDMKILEGVLDSGCGAELQEARQTLNNVRKLTPEGGYVYPVRFVPPDWFKQIGSSFTSADFMESPETLSERLQMLSARRMELYTFVQNVAELMQDENVKNALNRVKDIKRAIDTSRSAIVRNHGTTISNVLYSAVNLKSSLGNNDRVFNTLIKTYRREALSSARVVAVKRRLQRETELQADYINQLHHLVKIVEEANKSQSCEKIVMPVIKQLKDINAKIADVQNQLTISSGFFSADSKSTKLKSSDSTAVVPKGFTQVVIHSNFTELKNKSEQFSSTSEYTQGYNFLFLGKRQSMESSSTSTLDSLMNSNCNVTIEMNVAKVGIERDWFNPGVFALTKDMLKMGSEKISPEKDYDSMTDSRLNAMQKCVFPSYPVAMLIARDIKISFEFNSNQKVSTYYKDFERHARYGGNFFIFGGSSSNSSFATSRVHSSITDDRTITLKFDSTQLLGYYMEATRPDKSVQFDALSKDQRESIEYSSISDFVSTYKRILDSIKQTSQAEPSPEPSPEPSKPSVSPEVPPVNYGEEQ